MKKKSIDSAVSNDDRPDCSTPVRDSDDQNCGKGKFEGGRKTLNLIDKDSTTIMEGDILFNGSDYYHIYERDENEIEMISCTKGYIHNVKQEDLSDFQKVGCIETDKHLLECD